MREVLVVRFMACTARLEAERRGGGDGGGGADEMRRPFSVNTPSPASISQADHADPLYVHESLLKIKHSLTKNVPHVPHTHTD